MKRINKKNFGFTLVEMLVVISIIGVLSAILGGSYINSQKSARDAARKLNLKSIADALNMYYNDYGVLPATITFGGELSRDNNVYMKKIPSESTITGMKEIQYSKGTKSFKLYTNLENSEDKDCLPSCSGYVITKGCCFVITSSNIGINDSLL
jgi:prepilin-type N-terminal cleavage/methylation domain-containing protein